MLPGRVWLMMVGLWVRGVPRLVVAVVPRLVVAEVPRLVVVAEVPKLAVVAVVQLVPCHNWDRTWCRG